MNRAEKTKRYILERIAEFKDLEKLRQSRKDFFSAVKRFHDSTTSHLKRTRIVSNEYLEKLSRLFTEIDVCKTKGAENEVYWSRVGPTFSKVISLLYELARSMDDKKLPFLVQIRDFWDLSLLHKIVVGVIVFLGSTLIIYLLSALF